MALTYSSYKVLQRGSPAPDFVLPGIDEKNHSLKDFGGKTLLIVFMCNHCPFVISKIEKLAELQKKYKEKGLQIIGINSNNVKDYPEDSFEKMKEFAREKGINFVYLFDESQEVSKAYGAACTPDPFLFDAENKLSYHGRIDELHQESSENASYNDLEEAIQETLDGKEVSKHTQPSMGCNIKWKE